MNSNESSLKKPSNTFRYELGRFYFIGDGTYTCPECKNVVRTPGISGRRYPATKPIIENDYDFICTDCCRRKGLVW